LLGAQPPAGDVLLVGVVIAQRTAGSDATRLDTTMLVFTGSLERTKSEYQDLLHRAGLTLVKTTPLPHNSAFSRPHLPKTDSANGFPERN
jgi:hypothetical protein